MRKITLSLLTFFVVLSFSVHAQDDKTQRVQASYILAFGQMPSSGEITYWTGQPESASMSQLMAKHRSFINSGGYKKEAIINSYKDALGRRPSDGEIGYYSPMNMTYTDLMKNHIQWLSGNAGEYDKVINNAYRYALNRAPSTDELNSWKTNSRKYSYAMIAGYLQNKKSSYSVQCTASENAMSLGTSSLAITGVKVSNAILQELKLVPGLITNDGGTLIAAGAGKLITNDGGTLVASGAGNIALNSGAN